jgi:hypothetical protein
MEHSGSSSEPPETSPFADRPNFVGEGGYRRQHERYGRQRFNGLDLDFGPDRRYIRKKTRRSILLSALLPVQKFSAFGTETDAAMGVMQAIARGQGLGPVRREVGKQAFRLNGRSAVMPTAGSGAVCALAYVALAGAQAMGLGSNAGHRQSRRLTGGSDSDRSSYASSSSGSHYAQGSDHIFGPDAMGRFISGVKETLQRNFLCMGEHATMLKVAQGTYDNRMPEFMNVAFHFYRMQCAQGIDGATQEFCSAVKQVDLEIRYPTRISEENARHCQDPGFQEWLQTWPPSIELSKPPAERRSQAQPGMGGGALGSLRPPGHHRQGYNPGRFPGIPPRAMANLNHMHHLGTPHREHYPRYHHSSYSHDGGDGFGGYNEYGDPYYNNGHHGGAY